MLGIFDSGIGGLSVVRALRERAPAVDFVYFGDTANAPYGNRDFATLERLTLEGLRLLKHEGATHLLSACNSVSASVILPLFDLFAIKNAAMTEMVGPTVRHLREGDYGKLAMVATRATVESGMYQEGLRKAGISLDAVAIPDLVSIIERGGTDTEKLRCIEPAIRTIIEDGCDTLLLACTHFPFVAHLFRRALDAHGAREVALFNPASAVASETLSVHGATGSGSSRFLLSGESTEFRRFAEEVMRHTVVPEIRVQPSNDS